MRVQIDQLLSHKKRTMVKITKEATGYQVLKAAKIKVKKKVEDGKAFSEFQGMWLLKEKDMAMKERIQKVGLLDSLIAKKELLSKYEEALKKNSFKRCCLEKNSF
ncbi:hypothetical protein EUTSA_v10027591mg [Eutrema salsugineum]|uniref:Uncharacterized protein n=1 Tax=Eutrema salsugineum TaxID=72664 RepID=V4P9F0_EUTSA|nr:hypothetical protein EUTSA_v10027591mg [Eutrema salsugineum]